jgi:hypothetical protein
VGIVTTLKWLERFIKGEVLDKPSLFGKNVDEFCFLKQEKFLIG